jgi:4-amino-4-deoxy-L-arabinose transferase-like glycosyltransferase
MMASVSLSARHTVVLAALALIFASQATWSGGTTSGTYDESTYLSLGRGVFLAGDTSPLAGWGVSPLAVLLTTAAPSLAGSPPYPYAVELARISAIIFIDAPFVAIVFCTLLGAFGLGTATAGTAFLVLSPNLLGHAALATTDVCFMAAALAALAALVRHITAPSLRSRALLAFSLAVALAAKYSALGLFPIAACASFATSGGRATSLTRRIVDAVALAAGTLVIALLFVWGLHGFALVPYGLPPFESTLMPASIVGIGRQIHHQSLGEPSFLLGRHSNFGWWYYVPVALALKSTPAELLVYAAALVSLTRGWRSATPRGLVWRLAFVVFTAGGILNHIALGIRYVLVLFPLATFLAAEQWVATANARRSLRYVPAAVIAAQLFSVMSIAPHYLSYFNVFAGGPERGYLQLADSNIDWGQDLPALKSTLASLGARHPLLSYFGTAPLEAYGVEATPWTRDARDHFEQWDWVAISATHLDGLFLPSDPFIDFRELTPDARAGYSILLYATRRADVRAAMATAAARLQ